MFNLKTTGVIFLSMVLAGNISAFAQQPDADAMKKEFQRMDANKDGFVDQNDADAYWQKRFSELDRDKDGILDEEELKADKTGMFINADQNKDGAVSWQDAKKWFGKEYFDLADSNKDGKISEEEAVGVKLIKVKF